MKHHKYPFIQAIHCSFPVLYILIEVPSLSHFQFVSRPRHFFHPHPPHPSRKEGITGDDSFRAWATVAFAPAVVCSHPPSLCCVVLLRNSALGSHTHIYIAEITWIILSLVSSCDVIGLTPRDDGHSPAGTEGVGDQRQHHGGQAGRFQIFHTPYISDHRAARM